MMNRSFECAGQDPRNVEFNPEFPVIENAVSENQEENDIYFYHTDHLGSSSWITFTDGSVTQHLQNLPFGEPFIDQRATSYDIRYKFTGKEMDSETGYQYFGARYYDSDLSVWLSVDPLADKYPSMSAFKYVAGNPIKFIDPDGKDIFIYYMGPKKSFTGLLGHTAIGVNEGGDSPISYYPASGNSAAWIITENINNNGGVYYTYELDESKTMEMYAKNGDYVLRMRYKLPDDVEKRIKGYIDDYIESGGTSSYGDGAYCTLQVRNIIYDAYVESGYSDEKAQKEMNKIIPYKTPENPTLVEKWDSGVFEQTTWEIDESDNVVEKTEKFYFEIEEDLLLGSENNQ